jgi:hypothetical protein
MIPPYFQGDTVEFSITGNDVVNFDTENFIVTFYGKSLVKKIFQKSDMTNVSANVYSAKITGEETAIMNSGIYVMRIQIGTTEISTGENETSFLLKKLN